MRRFLCLLSIFILALAAGTIIFKHDPGYILLAYGTWTIEMQLWLAIVSIFIVMFGIYILNKCIALVINVPNNIRSWQQKKQVAHSIKMQKYQSWLTNQNATIEETKLCNIWAHIPKKYRREISVLKIFIAKLVFFDSQHVLAEKLIRTTLNNKWDDELIRYYSQITHENPSTLLNTTENWLIKYPQNIALILTIGEICLHAKMWGKAQQFFEKSLLIQPNPLAYLYLAQLHAQLNEVEKSNKCYKDGLSIAFNTTGNSHIKNT